MRRALPFLAVLAVAACGCNGGSNADAQYQDKSPQASATPPAPVQNTTKHMPTMGGGPSMSKGPGPAPAAGN